VVLLKWVYDNGVSRRSPPSLPQPLSIICKRCLITTLCGLLRQTTKTDENRDEPCFKFGCLVLPRIHTEITCTDHGLHEKEFPWHNILVAVVKSTYLNHPVGRSRPQSGRLDFKRQIFGSRRWSDALTHKKLFSVSQWLPLIRSKFKHNESLQNNDEPDSATYCCSCINGVTGKMLVTHL
jgi:hypothetical protein